MRAICCLRWKRLRRAPKQGRKWTSYEARRDAGTERSDEELYLRESERESLERGRSVFHRTAIAQKPFEGSDT